MIHRKIKIIGIIPIFLFLYLCSVFKTAYPQGRHLNSVRIGVFKLFKPTKIVISLPSSQNIIPIINRDIRYDFVLASKGTIELNAENHFYMNIRGKEGTREIFTVKNVKILQFAPNSIEGAPFDFILEIPKKIKRRYYGSLELRVDNNAIITPIIIKELEEIVSTIVAAEMKGEIYEETLKAQAVVVRSFLVAQKSRHSRNHYDFCDTTHCQLFQGKSIWEDIPHKSVVKIQKVTYRTINEILIKNSLPLNAYYTPLCSGYTATPEIIWGNKENTTQIQVRCPFHKKGNKYSQWLRSVSRTELLKILETKLGKRLSSQTTIQVAKKSKYGDYVQAVQIRSNGLNMNIQGEGFRRIIGQNFGWNKILSASFEISDDGDYFIFIGKGFGHGIGFCQYGAHYLAAEGKTYREILKFYFPNTQIGKW